MKLYFSRIIMTLILSIFSLSPCLAVDVITESEINKFLDHEKSYLNNKDLEGFLTMLSDDYVGVSRTGKVIDKVDIKLDLYKVYMVSQQVLHKVTLESAQIAKDGKSASVTMINDSKFLVERGGENRVFRNYNKSHADLVLINGEIKYKKSEFIKDLSSEL